MRLLFQRAIIAAFFCVIACEASAAEPLNEWVARQSTMPAEQALAQIPQLDCNVDWEKCRFFAVVETLAFARQCQTAMDARINARVKPEYLEEQRREDDRFKSFADKAIKGWRELAPAAFKDAALARSPMNAQLDKTTGEYLRRIPLGETGVECSRIGAMASNAGPAVEMSDLLTKTRNYASFSAGFNQAQQSRMDALRAYNDEMKGAGLGRPGAVK